jgi:hypothetical protein
VSNQQGDGTPDRGQKVHFWLECPTQKGGAATIPPGWRRVWRGCVIAGDRHLNVARYRQCGAVEWLEVSQAKIDEDVRALGESVAQTYTLLIRRGTDCPDRTCPGCEVNYCRTGYKFCDWCIQTIREDLAQRRDG